jgi:hypothetical protein
MARTRTRLVRSAAALVLTALGLLSYDAITQVASAAPPPVVTTDYAAYPPPLPAGCTAQGGAFLTGYRAFLQRPNTPNNVAPFIDPGPTALPVLTTRSMRRFEDLVLPGDTIVVRWTGWAPGCESLPVSFPTKATNAAFFDLSDDQALIREPNGPFNFKYCYANGVGPDGCAAPGGYELSGTVPQLAIVCGFQIDVVIGGPLETVGPNGSYYATVNRQAAVAAGLGTFNVNPPNMLIDAANGAMPCAPGQRIVIDKQWVGTGTQPPVNVPPSFVLTVTSSVSQTDLTEIARATCTVTNGVFTCSYVDAASPGVPQGGLLVNADSLLTVSETGFDGNSMDITFPVGMSSEFVNCQVSSGQCFLTITNTPPPPPPPPPPTVPPPTTIPPIDTSILPPPTPAPPETLPPTLPATGSSDATPLLLFGLVLVPIGVTLIAVTRRRARAN